MTRVRSPNYPAISLPDAIERIHKIHGKAHTHKVDSETMAKAAGYGGLNGAALTVLSALKKYGLLEEVGKEVRVSPLAVQIIADPVESADRKQAIQQAAFSPSLFTDLHKQFPGSIPSDDLVRSYLIKKGFATAAVDSPVKAFRETMKLVTDQGLGYSTESNPLDADTMLEELRSQTQITPKVVTGVAAAKGATVVGGMGAAATEVGTYPVSSECRIRLIADGPYDKTSIQALVEQLQLNLKLGVFPERANKADASPQEGKEVRAFTKVS
jgi:hypothetical protein